MPAWSYIVLEDVHPLYGGNLISVGATGDVWTVNVGRGGVARRFRGKMPEQAFRDLDRILVTRPPRDVPLAPRQAAPDEATTRLTFTAAGVTTVVTRMSGDRDDDFFAVVRFLDDIATAFAKNTSPVADGFWRGGFVAS